MGEEQLIATPCSFGENGGFLLERELGRGGMGGVYLGRDKMLDRQVAVKVMLKEYGSDAEFVDKFKREAQAAAKLIHPNIAQIYSFGVSGGMPYIAMELVAGGSLDKLMRNSGAETDVARVMKICEQTAQALRCASDSGLVHGDVKPENILLDANGNAKLVDFGLAAMQKDTNEIWGTPYYIAPEKVRKEQVDFRADIYSLGGTLYHALCGVAPFEGEDANAVVRKRFESVPAKPSEVRPGLSPQIDALVMKMLEFDPKDRHPSFEALLADFKKVMTSGLGGGAGAAGDGRKVLKINTKAIANIAETAVAGDGGEDDEEGGGLGKKVAIVAGSIVLAIALVVGGLFGYVKMSKSAEERTARELIEDNMRKAKESLAETRKTVEHFGGQIEEMAAAIAKECEEIQVAAAKVMEGAFPKEAIDSLKPAETAELADAKKAMEKGAKPAVAPKDAKPYKADPNAPEIVNAVREIWERNYAAQAAALRVRRGVNDLCAAIDEASAAEGRSKADMERAAAATSEMSRRFEAVKLSPDVTTVQKAKGSLKDKGERVIKKTKRRVFEEAQQKKRAEEKARREAEEKAREQAAEQAEAEKAAGEVAAVKAKFLSINENGNFRQLDWNGAKRQLALVETATGEGANALKREIKKIDMMASVQTILMRNLKGYTFARGAGRLASGAPAPNLKGMMAVSATASEISLRRGGGASALRKISWQQFYRDYHSNLAELCNRFITGGRENGSPKLNLKEQTEAMLGVALTMQLLYPDDATATGYGKSMAKRAVKLMPSSEEYASIAKELYPDEDFSAEREEEE